MKVLFLSVFFLATGSIALAYQPDQFCYIGKYGLEHCYTSASTCQYFAQKDGSACYRK